MAEKTNSKAAERHLEVEVKLAVDEHTGVPETTTPPRPAEDTWAASTEHLLRFAHNQSHRHVPRDGHPPRSPRRELQSSRRPLEHSYGARPRW